MNKDYYIRQFLTRVKNQPLYEIPGIILVTAIQEQYLSVHDLAVSFLDRIKERNPAVNAWVRKSPRNTILSQAKWLDTSPFKGMLHGIPIGVKDIYETCDFDTSYGSQEIYPSHDHERDPTSSSTSLGFVANLPRFKACSDKEYQPLYAQQRQSFLAKQRTDAVSIALLRHQGALVFGKTVTTEFASFQPSSLPSTRNPYNLEHTPGGSSSGSACAVADFHVPLATGSQTASSIIRPAAYCGVVGYKPSFGKINVGGVKLFSPTLDTLGIFSKTVLDAALGVACMSGDMNLINIHREGENYFHEGGKHHVGQILPKSSLTPLRIGIYHLPKTIQKLLQPESVSGLSLLSSYISSYIKGTSGEQKIVMLTVESLPINFEKLIDVHDRIMLFEMNQSLQFEKSFFYDNLSIKLREQLKTGNKITYEQYQKDLQYTRNSRKQINLFFKNSFDILILPSALGSAPNGLESTGNPILGRNWTLLGLPSINIPIFLKDHQPYNRSTEAWVTASPCGSGNGTNPRNGGSDNINSSNLPIGVQLVAGFNSDKLLLSIAAKLEGLIQENKQVQY